MDEVTRLVELLGHGNAAQDEEALALLAIHGRRAVEGLLAAASSPEPQRRSACLTALGRIGDPRARRTVILALADRNPLVRAAAATAVAAFPSEEAVSRLGATLKRETEPEVRLRGAATLVDMFNSGTVEALDPLLSLLGDQAGDRRVRLEALKILAFLPRSEARAIASRLLHDPDLKVAQVASAYSGTAQAERTGTEDALLDLGSTDYFIFRKAASLLASAGEEAVPTLVNALKERASDPAGCARVASVLREITRGRERSVTRLLDETDETLPLALLVDIIGESTDRTALYHLKGVIDRLEPDGGEPDPAREMILAKAHYYLARSGSRVAFDSLKRAMARQQGRLMGEILMAVQEIGGREELLDLISLYGHEQGWMRDQIREAFHRLMKKSRTRADDSVFARLDGRRRGWLTEILSVPGPHRGAPRGPARRRVDTI